MFRHIQHLLVGTNNVCVSTAMHSLGSMCSSALELPPSCSSQASPSSLPFVARSQLVLGLRLMALVASSVLVSVEYMYAPVEGLFRYREVQGSHVRLPVLHLGWLGPFWSSKGEVGSVFTMRWAARYGRFPPNSSPSGGRTPLLGLSCLHGGGELKASFTVGWAPVTPNVFTFGWALPCHEKRAFLWSVPCERRHCCSHVVSEIRK